MKKLSIITVCYNEEKTIEQTIRSVLNQSFQDFEYIIIDGGSNDGTVDIINNYKDKIDHFVSEADNGIFDAFNKGIGLSNAEYVYFLNAGDYFCSDNVLESIFAINPNAELVYGDIIVEMNSGWAFRKKSPSRICLFYMFVDSIPHQATFTKRELFDKAGLYDLSCRIAADYRFSLKAIYQHNATLQYIPQPIAYYNLRGDSGKKENRKKHLYYRDLSQRLYFKRSTYLFLKATKPLWILIFKYLRIAFSMVFSRIKQ